MTRSCLKLILLILLTLPVGSFGQDTLTVTNDGFTAYLIDGESNPDLTVIRGHTYMYIINASGHPFWINSQEGIGTGNAYNNGVTGNGTSTGTLTFTVPEDAPDTLFYNCQFHSAMTGMIKVTSTVGNEREHKQPETFSLRQNYPNPFNPWTSIGYTVSEPGHIDLSVYSLTGQKIKCLINRSADPGEYAVTWDGRDESGNLVSSGVYLYRLESATNSFTRRMILLK